MSQYLFLSKGTKILLFYDLSPLFNSSRLRRNVWRIGTKNKINFEIQKRRLSREENHGRWRRKRSGEKEGRRERMAHIILKFNWVSVPGEVNTGANLTRRGPLGIRATSLHPSARYSSSSPPPDPVWISLPTRPLLFANITYFLAIEKNEKFFHSSFIKNSEWREYTIDFKLIKIEFLRNKFLRNRNLWNYYYETLEDLEKKREASKEY